MIRAANNFVTAKHPDNWSSHIANKYTLRRLDFEPVGGPKMTSTGIKSIS
jgi:hypothetical protein